MLGRQIRTWDVFDERVLHTIAANPRERFVPAGWAPFAYADMAIPLGHGHAMLEPKVEARLLQAAAITPRDAILEIGTGSGFFTALLSALGRTVHTTEIHDDLLETARGRLQAHGVRNVTYACGNGLEWLTTPARFDVIMVTGSVPDLSCLGSGALRENGRMLAFVGTGPVMEAVLLPREGGHASAPPRGSGATALSQHLSPALSQESLFDTWVAPLEGVAKPELFTF
jgi:protein-L-isoaspartate(D-aspartate) O-methyltransferase